MTEDEAKTNACCGPFFGRLAYGSARDAGEIAAHGLHPDYIAETVANWPCIGSACMAWRWDRGEEGGHGRPYIEAIKRHREEHGSSLVAARDAVDATWTRPAPTNGFCGLAGAPQ